MKTTQFIVSSAAFAALTSSVSAATLILPIGQSVDNDFPGLLIQDPEGGGLAWLNTLTGDGIGVGSAPATFFEDDISFLFGSGAPLSAQGLVGGDMDDNGGMADVTPIINSFYITQIHSSDTCGFNESALLEEDPDGSPFTYAGKVAFQDLTAGEHFFNFRVTRIADDEQFYGFVKYTTNPDFSMNVIVAGFNTTAGEAAACPDGLGLVPAALGMGLVMLRHARRCRAAVQG